MTLLSGSAPRGAFRFSLSEGSALDALFDGWLMSDSKPHSRDDLRLLTLNMLRPLRLTPEQGAGALNSFLRNNACFYPSQSFCYNQPETAAIVKALLDATPDFKPGSLRLNANEMKALGGLHPQIPLMIESALALSEANQISHALARPGKKSSPRARV